MSTGRAPASLVQVSAVLHDGMFSRPEAVLALHVVGADLGEAQATPVMN